MFFPELLQNTYFLFQNWVDKEVVILAIYIICLKTNTKEINDKTNFYCISSSGSRLCYASKLFWVKINSLNGKEIYS